uniref:AAA+ ATPase domain-containing protein n=3 Tax=Tetranychus urticae TaxID=32264 RepID=T1JTB6_TETUR
MKQEKDEREAKISSCLSSHSGAGHVVSSLSKTVHGTGNNCLPRVKNKTKPIVNFNLKMSKDQSDSGSTVKPTATVKGTSTSSPTKPSNELKSTVKMNGQPPTSPSTSNNLHQPSIAKVSPILQSKRSDNVNTDSNEILNDSDKRVNLDCNNDCVKSDEDNVNVNCSNEDGNENCEDKCNVSFGVKPLGPLKIHETGNYGLNDFYCTQPNCTDKRNRVRSDCGRAGCRLSSRSSSIGNHHRSREDSSSRSPCYRRSSGGSPRKCRRRCDNSNYIIENANSIEDSFDDTSSLSSESATTATTTSSSMSSSTYGDIPGILNHQLIKTSSDSNAKLSVNHQFQTSASNQHQYISNNQQQYNQKAHQQTPHKSSKHYRNGNSNHSMSNDLNRSTNPTCSPAPPATPTHCPVIRSPRKSSNVKKADSSIQTESSALSGRSVDSIHHNSKHSIPSSLPVWKKYIHEQHIVMKPNTISASSNQTNIQPGKGAMGSSGGSSSGNKMSSDFSMSNDSLRHLKYTGSKGCTSLGFIGNGLSGSSTIGSPYHPNNSDSKAIAVIRATSATTGRIPNHSKSYAGSGRLKGTGKGVSQTTGSSSPYSYSDGVYSDTEYMMSKRSSSSASNYYNNKYSYLTSPVRIRGNQSNSRTTGNTNGGNSGPSSLPYSSSEMSSDWLSRDSSGYGQILSPWLQRNGFGLQRNALTEAESMESLNDNGKGFQGNGVPGSRLHGTNGDGLGHSRRPSSVTSKLNSNQGDHSSTPSRLPMTPNRSRLRASNGSILASPSLGSDLTRKTMDKDSDLYSSALSLVSNSTVFTQVEDKHNLEVRKLKRDLEQANEKVITLTSQLNTNAHMVTAFEQSLSVMNSRLQQLTSMSERKDVELTRLRNMIDEITCHKKRDPNDSIESSPVKKGDKKSKENKSLLIRRHTFASVNSDDLKSNLPRHRSKDSVSSSPERDVKQSGNKNRKKDRKYSADTIDSQGSIPVQSSKGWLRSSLTKAFRKSKNGSKCHGSISDAEILSSMGGNVVRRNGCALMDSCSVPSSPMMTLKSYRDLPTGADRLEDEMVDGLKQQLREKEKALTDLRLESLTAAHQLDNFKEMVNKMRAEMMSLKQDNDRLQRMVITKSLASSKSSVLSGSGSGGANGTNGLSPNGEAHQHSKNSSIQLTDLDDTLLEGGRKVSLLLGSLTPNGNNGTGNGLLIGTVIVSPETTWGILDALVRKTVQDYLDRIDSDRNLGLSLESIAFYEVGSERQLRNLRSSSSSSSGNESSPELLPFGYIVNESIIKLGCRSFLESFVFETLIPKNIIQRFVSLLHDHKRLILYGPSGTGKTYLASKLAEYLVVKIQRGDRTSKESYDSGDGDNLGEMIPPGSIATFNIDHKSANELKSYLTTLGEQLESSDETCKDLPTVIILDNLHHVTSIDDLFTGNTIFHKNKFPFIIATMCQSNSCTPNLQLNHNFRWLLCANHMEPVRGFLSRYLKRKLVTSEIDAGSIDLTIPTNMITIVDWIPKVWNHINHFLEVHHSSDVTLGPSLFITCPIDLESSRAWFNDLWNYSIHPYLIQAAREGLQKNGLRSPFEDPTSWIIKTYPWKQSLIEDSVTTNDENGSENSTININPIKLDDIQPYPGLTISSPISDPLSDMLLRLQVATSANEDSDGSGLGPQSQNKDNSI